MTRSWQVQEVKQRLSAVIRCSIQEGPQRITLRGEACAWIVSEEDFEQLKRSKKKESLVAFFQRSPHRDLVIPWERRKDLPRGIEL